MDPMATIRELLGEPGVAVVAVEFDDGTRMRVTRAAKPAPATPVFLHTRPASWVRVEPTSVPCSACGAGIDQACTDEAGHPLPAHLSRVANAERPGPSADPLSVPCPVCTASVGTRCNGSGNAPHFHRVLTARLAIHDNDAGNPLARSCTVCHEYVGQPCRYITTPNRGEVMDGPHSER